ncbi:hypothetical protein K502DRAFT_363590 [Neoconidiobolus thromboides FSU 785]|nr:hypothetical protein K502DRAFT_363590 [Neoconidiobolus thromboides FSU 785]
MGEPNNNHINADEAALYDRQIRVWGFQAQQKMKNSTIGVIGTSGLAIELMKNIVLAGIGKLVIFDQREVDGNEIGSNFYLSINDIGRKRAEVCAEKLSLLNPKVTIEIKEILDRNSLERVQLLCHNDATLDEMKEINLLCRDINIKYIAGNTFGLYGYLFFDLLEHEFIVQNKEDETIIEKNIHYKSLDDILTTTIKSKSKKQILRNYSSSLFLIQILHHFTTQMGRKPKVSNESDYKSFSTLSLSKANNLFKLQPKLVNEVYNTLCSEEKIKEVITFCQGELSPSTAILGGIMAQEALKIVSQKDMPINNYFVYNGVRDEGLVHTIE